MEISLKTKIALTLASTIMLFNGIERVFSGELHSTLPWIIYGGQIAIPVALYSYMVFLLVRFVVRKVKTKQVAAQEMDTPAGEPSLSVRRMDGEMEKPKRRPVELISYAIVALLVLAAILQLTGAVDLIGMLENPVG